MSAELIVTTSVTPLGSVLAVAGDMDHTSTEQFRTAVDAVALQPGRPLFIDLAGLTFCDSTGITALIAAHNHAQTQGADIVLTAVPDSTLRMLQFVGLDQFFRIQATPGDDARSHE
jgi:anti-sigma B factor antagonist